MELLIAGLCIGNGLYMLRRSRNQYKQHCLEQAKRYREYSEEEYRNDLEDERLSIKYKDDYIQTNHTLWKQPSL